MTVYLVMHNKPVSVPNALLGAGHVYSGEPCGLNNKWFLHCFFSLVANTEVFLSMHPSVLASGIAQIRE